MADLVLTGEDLRVALTDREPLWALRQDDIVVPLSSIRAIRVMPDGLRATQGLRAPGLGVPGRRKVGTWRARGRRTFVSVRQGQAAVFIRLRGRKPFDAILVGHDRADEMAALISQALPPTHRDEQVVLEPATEALRGSLRLPGEGRQPAALLLPGSGPIDRDGDAPGMPLSIQLALAEGLAEMGIASLRYDRRGVGDGTDWRAVGLDENTSDAARALQFLARHPQVDPDRIVVIGHSEGSLHALRLAVAEQHVAAAVLLSAPARPGGDVLLWQAGQVEPGLPKPAKAVIRLARIDLTAKTRAAHEKLRATTSDIARINGAKVNAKWFREFLDDDPREDLRLLTVPVLALTGTADLQTPPADLDVIAELSRGPVDVRRPEGISHLLRRDPSPQPTLSDYKRQVRLPVDAGVMRTLVGWVVQQVGA